MIIFTFELNIQLITAIIQSYLPPLTRAVAWSLPILWNHGWSVYDVHRSLGVCGSGLVVGWRLTYGNVADPVGCGDRSKINIEVDIKHCFFFTLESWSTNRKRHKCPFAPRHPTLTTFIDRFNIFSLNERKIVLYPWFVNIYLKFWRVGVYWRYTYITCKKELILEQIFKFLTNSNIDFSSKLYVAYDSCWKILSFKLY